MSSTDPLLIDLFVSWLTLALNDVSEYSANLVLDWRKVIIEGKARAGGLGIEWSDEMIPDYIQQSLSWADEDEKESQP